MEKIQYFKRLIKKKNVNIVMDRLSVPDKNIAECVGLWLAEGDNKSKGEITFTNSCWDLVDLFYNTINRTFKGYPYNPRIYVYSNNKERVKIPYKNLIVKYYIHKRATKPFFILRFASVKMIREWRGLVVELSNNKEFYPFILRGFFAGEGNIHTGVHGVRRLRISQKTQKEFIDEILTNLKIKFSFDPSHRNYIIYGKWNWDIFARLKLADLHPNKKEKFWSTYESFKENHYPTNHLIKEIYSLLDKPTTPRELSKKFNRSFTRIQDVLILLKKQGKAFNHRVGNIDYWTNNDNLIIISKLKKNYLLLLDKPKQTSEFAKKLGVTWKASFRRLKELERLNLVERDKIGKWIKISTKKKILIF